MITLQCLVITVVLVAVFSLLTVREQRIQDKLNKGE
jgi:preprotein translocase subunit YajC